MKLRLTDFDSNTYEDTEGSCERCMYTGMLDHPLYTFTDSYGGEHVIEGWYSQYGHMTVFDINLPVFTSWLHDVDFKEPEELADYVGVEPYADNRELWNAYLSLILSEAQLYDTGEQLSKGLRWALID